MVKSRLHNLETDYAKFLVAGKKDDAAKTLRLLTSALDKAAKTWVIHQRTGQSEQIAPEPAVERDQTSPRSGGLSGASRHGRAGHGRPSVNGT